MDFLLQAWFILLLSLIISVIFFPFTFFFSFVYETLSKNSKIPKIVWMFTCIFIAVLIGVIIINAYLNYTLPSALRG
jgi:VIT1/CCC1 family predicted Fe2+/Mn2+ transporter